MLTDGIIIFGILFLTYFVKAVKRGEKLCKFLNLN